MTIKKFSTVKQMATKTPCLAHVAKNGDEPEQQTQPKRTSSNKMTKTKQQNITADTFRRYISVRIRKKT